MSRKLNDRYTSPGAELLPARSYEARYVARMPVLGFAFDGQRGMHAFASDRIAPFARRPNSISIVPRNCDVYSQSDYGGEYLVVPWPSEFQDMSGWIDGAILNDLIIPGALRSASRIRRLMLSGKRESQPVLIDEVAEFCLIVFTAIANRQHDLLDPRWLTKRRQSMVDAYIEANIDQDIRIRDLAAVLDLSPGYFVRMFNVGTGTSPHRYVMARRIALARRLCCETPMALRQIALRAGFSSQAHMTTAFRREIGLTPGRLRTLAMTGKGHEPPSAFRH